MAKIVCLDDFPMYAEMVALMLEKKGGHQVLATIHPVDARLIEDFAPDVIIVNLVRKVEALGERLRDFDTQVDGARALREIERHPRLAAYPRLITAIGLRESELPPGLHYLAFLEVPNRFDHLLIMIDNVVKARGDILPD